jgi:signal transduction histidine kinase
MPLLDANDPDQPMPEVFASTEPLAQAVEAAGLGHFELDLRQRVMRWSPAVFRMFDLMPGASLPLDRLHDRICADDVAARRAAFERALREGGAYDARYRVVRADGSLRWLAVSGRVVREPSPDGTPRAVRIVGIVDDRSERSAVADALREADRSRDQLLSLLGHDLRNPLAPLATAAELLRRELSPERAQSISDMISRQVAQMSRLIDDVLDVSRIGQGRLSLQRERVEVGALVTQAAGLARSATERRGMQLDLDLPEAPFYVDADPAQLARIVVSMIQNAVKNSGRGDVIRIGANRQGAEVEIRVADPGAGFAPAWSPQVFELFTSRPEAAPRGRLNVELALVKALTQLHGGTVAARSEGEGRGSEIVVRLSGGEPFRG